MFFKPFLLNIIEVPRFLKIEHHYKIDVWRYGFWINMQHR